MNRTLFTVKNIKFVPTKLNKAKYAINKRQIQIFNQTQNRFNGNRIIKRNFSFMPNQNPFDDKWIILIGVFAASKLIKLLYT
jgi:hypothetical protein